jgi:hypothetical protein
MGSQLIDFVGHSCAAKGSGTCPAITEIPFPNTQNVPKNEAVTVNTKTQSETTPEGSITAAQNLIVRSHTVVITNQGTATAHNLRIGHFILPIAYTVFPAMNVPFDETHPKNEILVPTLSPNENVTISYLYDNSLNFSGVNSYIKCDEGLAEKANLEHISIKSPFLRNTLQVIFFIGIVAVTYWIIKIGICLYSLCAITNH